MKPVSTGSIILGAALILFFHEYDMKRVNKRLDAIEHKYETSGIIVNGWEYQVIPYLFPTNAVEYFKNPPPKTP